MSHVMVCCWKTCHMSWCVVERHITCHGVCSEACHMSWCVVTRRVTCLGVFSCVVVKHYSVTCVVTRHVTGLVSCSQMFHILC